MAHRPSAQELRDHYKGRGLPDKPMLPGAVLIADRGDLDGGIYTGPIRPGMVFAWEPWLPWARMLVIVRSADDLWVQSWDMHYRECHSNELERFREAVVATLFKDFPAEPPTLADRAKAAEAILGSLR